MVNYVAMVSDRRSIEVLAAIEKLRQLTDLFQRRRAELARRVGITEQQWRVLEEITSEHFMPSLFARENSSSAPAVSKVLRQLIDKELIAASISEIDGRQRQYELTAAGKALMKKLRHNRQQAIETIWNGIDAGSLQQFNRFADQLIDRIATYTGDKE